MICPSEITASRNRQVKERAAGSRIDVITQTTHEIEFANSGNKVKVIRLKGFDKSAFRKDVWTPGAMDQMASDWIMRFMLNYKAQNKK
jgi:hypothetical protein